MAKALEKEILVNLPPTDAEIFEHIATGNPPVRPVRMTINNYRAIQSIHRLAIAGLLAFTLGLAYGEYGSFKGIYDAAKNTLENTRLDLVRP